MALMDGKYKPKMRISFKLKLLRNRYRPLLTVVTTFVEIFVEILKTAF